MDRSIVTRPGRPLLAGWAASLAVGATWYGLSLATGLIFHLLPAGVGLAGAWAFREAAGARTQDGSPVRRASRNEVAGVAGAALAVVLAADWSITASRLALDAPWVTGGVAVLGAALAAYWLRR